MFHGLFHPRGCVDSLCPSILRRTSMDSACIHCTHVFNAFASLVRLESTEGEPAKKTRMYSQETNPDMEGAETCGELLER